MFSPQKQFEIYQAMKAMGERALAAEHFIYFDGFDEMRFLVQEFPLPLISPEEAIEVPAVGGMKLFAPSMARTHFTGTLTIAETVAGHGQLFLEQIAAERTISKRARIDLTIYRGDKDDYTRKWRCFDCILHSFDAPSANMEGNSLLVLSGQINGHYFPNVE